MKITRENGNVLGLVLLTGFFVGSGLEIVDGVVAAAAEES